MTARTTHHSTHQETSMPTFDTPAPITVDVDVVGNVRITASDRSDTVVAVTPLRPGRSADERAAAETVVEFANGRLSIRTPRRWTRFTPRGGGDSIDLAVELPTGSTIDARTGFGDIHCDGELGECRLKSGMGAVRVDHDLRPVVHLNGRKAHRPILSRAVQSAA